MSAVDTSVVLLFPVVDCTLSGVSTFVLGLVVGLDGSAVVGGNVT